MFVQSYPFPSKLWGYNLRVRKHGGGTVKLSAIQIKQTKPKEKDYKLFDGEGLFLLIKKTGQNTGV
jgi:hypothetical protein